MRYVSKPTVIEAVQWTGDGKSLLECEQFGDGKVRALISHDEPPAGEPGASIELLAGKDGAQEWVPVPVGHWLVNQPGDKSDIWPVDPDYFAAKYDPEPDDAPA